MRELTDEKRAELRRRLAEIEAEMPASMTPQEAREYLVRQGYAREMSEEEVRQHYGGYGVTTMTFIGAAPSIGRGDVVKVQGDDGVWRNRMVATGLDAGIVYVTAQEEWERAATENREPQAVAYPAAQVALVSDASEESSL